MSIGLGIRSAMSNRKHFAIPLAAIFFVLLIAAVACGGSASPGVATVPTATATPTASVSPASSAIGSPASAVSPTVSLTPGPAVYSACMRAHGVSQFPDLTDFGTSFKLQMQASGIDPHTQTFQAASQACQGLFVAPGSAQPTITAAEQADYLQAVACVRSHGFPQLPDPVFSNGGVRITVPPSIDQSSTLFANAVTTCQKLIPAGLPYSGTN